MAGWDEGASDGCRGTEGTEKVGLAELGWEGPRSGGTELVLSCLGEAWKSGPAMSTAGAAFVGGVAVWSPGMRLCACLYVRGVGDSLS